jgi:hypothetical protein
MRCRPILVAALLLATSTTAKAASSCSARATQVWSASPTQNLTIEALADGPTCGQAVALLVIRNSKGEAVWTESTTTSDNFIFEQGSPSNPREMASTLKEWITKDERLSETGALPEWKNGSETPEGGEFPFYVHEGILKDDYTQLRDAKLPMFCYVAGIESEACLVLNKDGSITEIGSQSFPG